MFENFTKSFKDTAATIKRVCADPEVKAAALNVADATATIAGLMAFAAAKNWIVTEGRDAIERAYENDDSGKAAAVKMLGDIAELTVSIETVVSTTCGVDQMTKRCESRAQKAIEEKRKAVEQKSEPETPAAIAYTDIGCSEAKRQAIEQELEAALSGTDTE